MAGVKKGMSGAELSGFCGQIALILEAGLPLYDGMEILTETLSEGESADMIRRVSEKVTETGSLYQALKEDDRWPAYMTAMAGVGEQSGRLEHVMRSLERYYEREDRIRNAVVSAVTYPLTLGALLLVIVFIMLWRVLPVFRRVIGTMGGGIGGSSSLLMRAGSVVGWIVLVVVGAVFVLVVICLLLLRTGKRDQLMAWLQKRFSFLGSVTRKLSASRAADVLSMTLSGGFPMEDALTMTGEVLTDKAAAEKVREISEHMSGGETFAEAVTASGLFDELENRMLVTGTRTGREDQVLGRIAQLYEERAEDEISTLVSIIEPSLVALLSIVIGAVLLSVMLPMAGILSSL